MKLAEKTDVIKASPAIQIQSKITHLQRRAWNVLLANAYDALPTIDIHSVTIAELADKLEFDSGNKDYLKETLEALVDCKVKWNVLDKDKKQVWGVASLLASAEIKDGVCTYSYAGHLKPKLHNPRIYAKINLRLQNRFDSKYGLILWELCFDYFDESRGQGETPFIPLDTFRELMGIDNEKYQGFKILNRDVIKPAVEEINGITNYLVEVEYKRRQKRRVVAVKFRIQKLKQIPERTIQRTLFPDLDDLPPVAIELIQAGVSRQESLKITNQEWGYVSRDARPSHQSDFFQFVQEKIHLAQNTPDVENVGGFVIAAIHENYPNPEFRKELEEQRAKARKEKIEALEAAQKQKQNALIRKIINENPTILEQAAEKITFSFARERIQIYDTAAEAYQKGGMVTAEINRIIRKELHPDKFKIISEEYEAKIAAVQ